MPVSKPSAPDKLYSAYQDRWEPGWYTGLVAGGTLFLLFVATTLIANNHGFASTLAFFSNVPNFSAGSPMLFTVRGIILIGALLTSMTYVWFRKLDRQRKALGGRFLFAQEKRHNGEFRTYLERRKVHEAERQMRIAKANLARVTSSS